MGLWILAGLMAYFVSSPGELFPWKSINRHLRSINSEMTQSGNVLSALLNRPIWTKKCIRLITHLSNMNRRLILAVVWFTNSRVIETNCLTQQAPAPANPQFDASQMATRSNISHKTYLQQLKAIEIRAVGSISPCFQPATTPNRAEKHKLTATSVNL